MDKKLIYFVRFDHEYMVHNPDHSICFPLVGACGKEITFPICHMNDYDNFKNVLLLAFCKG